MDYTVLEQKYINDLKCTVKIYAHNKTGAKIVVIPACDNNRAISIAFSTPAENNKGIPHIIEHSVFCGSGKYPLKDPFVQLMKGSMFSFLNAMTYSDFTVFPAASINEKDFENLADVYLDAVFDPLMPFKKEIFLQEGRYFELDEKEEAVFGFNGVVFNEMRGMEGSADFHMDNAVRKALFENLPYRFESGGLPLAIADLSYEELVDYYKRHYTASNSLIFLYGEIDEGKMLRKISENYLNRYQKTEVYTLGKAGLSNSAKSVAASYPSSEENMEKGYYFSYNFALPLEHTALNALSISVLDRLLCSSQGAYIASAMQAEGIGEDFYSTVDTMIKYPCFGFNSALCYADDRDRFVAVIDRTLQELVENGIDKERLRSAIRILEFHEKEVADEGTPKGITYAFQLLPKLLYNESDPLEALETIEAINKLKTLVETDYFEQFIKKHFLNNGHKALITLSPDSRFFLREEESLWEKCTENVKKENFSDIINDYRRLNMYRNAGDTREAEEKIPILDRCDLTVGPKIVPSEKLEAGARELLFQNKNTNGIAYFDWLFDLRFLDKELLPYYRIFTELFGTMDTKKHTYSELSDLIDSYTGGISHSLLISNSAAGNRDAVPYMVWHSAFLYENADKVFEINKEILLDTDFSDTGHIYDMLLQLKTGYMHELLESSHITAKKIGLSMYSSQYAWEDRLQGYSFYLFLCELLETYDDQKCRIVSALEKIRTSLMDRRRWICSYVGGKDFLESAQNLTKAFYSLLSEQETESVMADTALADRERLAFCLPSQVQYTAFCGRLPEEALEKRGNFLVLEHMLNTDYLWQNIRVMGGAYGASVSFDYTGTAAMISFRDPGLDETFSCYRGVIEYVKFLDLSERELRQFIIGAMNKLDQPKTPYDEGISQIQNELCGICADEIKRVRKQIIETTLDDIKSLVPYLEKWLESAAEVVIGNEQIIKESALPFDRIGQLL